MLVDVIRHQHAHLRAAIAALASLDATVQERVDRARRAVEEAFAAGVPVWAADPVATVRAHGGDATRVAADTPRAELAVLTTAIVDLYTLACREYWTA